MKLLIVHDYYGAYSRGGEAAVFEQETRDLRVRLGEGNVFTYTNRDSRHWLRWPLFTIFWNFAHYRAIREMVRKNGINIVHIHNFFPYLSASVFFAAKAEKVKVVHTLHNYRWWCIGGVFYTQGNICETCTQPGKFLWGIFQRCYRNSRRHSILATLAIRFYRAIGTLRTVDAFIALTLFQKAKIASLGIPEKKIVLKPNCVADTVMEKRRRNGFLFVGHLDTYKGIEVLLQSWQEHAINYPLTVIGSGPLEKTLKARYGNDRNIWFLGQLPHHEVNLIMQVTRFLIHPSLCYETFGLTIIEAMQNATPVIGFAIGTRSDFIQDGHNGFLTTPRKLAQTIEHAATFGGYVRMQRNAQDFARQFKQEIGTDAQIDIYRGLLI